MYSSVLDMLKLDGYVVLEDFLSPQECDELVEAGLEFTTKLPNKEQRCTFTTKETPNQNKDMYFLESNDKIRPFFEEAALDSEGNLLVDPKLSLNKVGHALHLLHPLFRCYTYCHRVKSVCYDLGLKKPAVVQSMLIYKNPGVGGAVTPHQDATYLFTEPQPPVGFWIALADTSVENGCLWIARGSHKSGVHRRMIRNPDKTSAHLIVYDQPAPTYPEFCFTAVPVRKGTCIVLHGHVVHKSAINRSDQPRPAYTFHVIEQCNTSYSPDNWLQEGKGAPFQNLYETLQLVAFTPEVAEGGSGGPFEFPKLATVSGGPFELPHQNTTSGEPSEVTGPDTTTSGGPAEVTELDTASNVAE